MPLKAVLENLEGVDEKFQSLYKPNEQGVFILDIEPESIKAHPSTSGLRSAQLKIAEEYKTLKKEAYDLRGQITELGDIEELKALKGKFDSAEMIPKEKFESLVEMKRREIQESARAQQSDLAKQVKEAQEGQAEAIRQLNTQKISTMLTTAAVEAGVTKAAVPVVVKLGLDTWQMGEDGKPKALDSQGLEIPGDGETPLSTKAWAKRLENSHPFFFTPGSGGGAKGSRLNGGGQDLSKMAPRDRIDHIRNKAQ